MSKEKNFGEIYEKFDDNYKKFFLEVVRDMRDCHLCSNYSSWSDPNADSTAEACEKGYFHLSGYSTPEIPYSYWFGCKGADFAPNYSSEEWVSIYNANKDNIHAEVKKRIRNKERKKGEM